MLQRVLDVLKKGDLSRRVALALGIVLLLWVLVQIALRALVLLPWIAASAFCLYYGLEEKPKR